MNELALTEAPTWRCIARPVSLGGRQCNYVNLAQNTTCAMCGCDKAASDARRRKRAPPLPPDDELARKLNATQLVEEYTAAAEDIRKGFAIIQAAQERLNRAFYADGPTGRLNNAIDVGTKDRHPLRWDAPCLRDVLEHIEDQAWYAVAARLDVWACLSPSRNKELGELLAKGAMPPLTVEAIMSMASSIHGQLGSLIQQCVGEVYDYLRPRDKHYTRAMFKSNSPYKVGKRVVLDRVITTSYLSWHLYHGAAPELSALERVMSMLDGKGTTAPESGSPLCNGIRDLAPTQGGTFTTEYFKVRAFKNGNLHLYFLREDLLLEFNRVAGSRTLAPGDA